MGAPHSPTVADRGLQRRPALGRARLFAAVGALAAVVAAANLLPAKAQTATTPVTVTLNPLVSVGQSVTNLPLGPQSLNVIVTNNSPALLVNQQAVVRVPPAPSFVASVTDGTTNVGTIDSRTGVWYHTIPQIPGGATVILTVSWQSLCPGLWPLAARVGDKVSAVKGIWVGPPNASCTPDDTASPLPASYYALPWPPTSGTAAPTVAGATTTVLGATTTAPTPTVLGATTTAVVTAPLSPTTTALATPTTPVTVPATTPIGSPTTLLSLGVTTTALVSPVTPGATTTTKPATATTKAGTATTAPAADTSASPAKATTTTKKSTSTKTTLIICKTIQGKRYCGASSSVYKDGQPKAKEISPTKTTKKKK